MERCKNPGSQNKFSWDTSNFSVAFSPKAQSASSCISFMVYTVNQQLWWLMTWSFYKWMISNILFIKIVNLFFSTCSFVVICYTATGDQNVRQGYCEGVVLWLLIWVQLGEKYETIQSILMTRKTPMALGPRDLWLFKTGFLGAIATCQGACMQPKRFYSPCLWLLPPLPLYALSILYCHCLNRLLEGEDHSLCIFITTHARHSRCPSNVRVYFKYIVYVCVCVCVFQ